MELVKNLVYEYKKGTKPMGLFTGSIAKREAVENFLKNQGVYYFIRDIGSGKMNIFLGNEAAVKIVREYLNKGLEKLSPEEDFILGIMLGYCRLEQCKRYLSKKGKLLSA